jgi:hypothetical protein
MYRTEQVEAWTLHETAGLVQSVSVAGDAVYLMVERGGDYFIEQVDDALNMDAALTGEASTPTTLWSGLAHLNGQTVSVVADGRVQSVKTVSAGEVTIDDAALKIEIGLNYTHVIEPLPTGIVSEAGSSRAVRLIEAVFRVRDTSALRLDTGRGLRDIPLRGFADEELLDAPMPMVSADIKVRAFGWIRDMTKPLWRIEQDLPLPFTLLAVNMEVNAND